MTKAALAFINSLSPELKKAAMLPFDHPDREEFVFVPRDDRNGARLSYMNEEQRRLAFEFLKTGLSDRGYKIVRDIMSLEEILFIKENQKEGSDYRNPTKYYVTFFGTPSDEAPWSWTYEGHHLSLNYSSVLDKLSVTPVFLGTNPAEVDIDKDRGKRVLGDIEDSSRAFMLSLNDDQRAKALISEKAYPEILTESKSVAKIENFEGLSYADMTTQQQTELVALIKMHISIMKPEVAAKQWGKIRDKGLDKIHWSWAGSTKRNEGHYYRIHGPATIIEYDNTQNNANHIHLAWRDTEDDFGRNLLQEHHRAHEH